MLGFFCVWKHRPQIITGKLKSGLKAFALKPSLVYICHLFKQKGGL